MQGGEAAHRQPHQMGPVDAQGVEPRHLTARVWSAARAACLPLGQSGISPSPPERSPSAGRRAPSVRSATRPAALSRGSFRRAPAGRPLFRSGRRLGPPPKVGTWPGRWKTEHCGGLW